VFHRRKKIFEPKEFGDFHAEEPCERLKEAVEDKDFKNLFYLVYSESSVKSFF